MKTIAQRVLESASFSPTGCILWTTGTNNKGYGKFKLNGAYHLAHRASYTAFVGPIPKGLLVCHTCDVRRCIRPDHLFCGTATDNNRDMMAKGRARLGVHRKSDSSISREVHPRGSSPRGDPA